MVLSHKGNALFQTKRKNQLKKGTTPPGLEPGIF